MSFICVKEDVQVSRQAGEINSYMNMALHIHSFGHRKLSYFDRTVMQDRHVRSGLCYSM